MIRGLFRDIDAALRNDPAARTRLEVLMAYPGVHALALHRLSHGLWKRDRKLLARLVSHYNRFLTGVEIHPGAQIADGVFIDHGMGVVIGETAIVETGCIIYKGVVLGGTTLKRQVRHPHLFPNVIVGSNACILGAIEIGEGARIGSGSVVIKDVPAGATVVGVPARVVQKTPKVVDQLDHAALPDPVAEVMRAFAEQHEALIERLSALEERLGIRTRALRPLDQQASEGEVDEGEVDPRRRAGSIF